MDAEVRFDRVSCHFGDVKAVDDVSFEIAEGEFFAMLGPSGSGKTTCLRMIAGFQYPTQGKIFIHGEDDSSLPPFERNVNTVFQDYALFPHMSVLDNVAYGLMVKKVAKRERHMKADEMLELVKLSGYGNRRPSELSGGQRQRVALARALINRPRVLLLDEPLGALDQKLREQMQVELKALQRQVGITFVFVTHDQQEALSMSDRMAVFNEGRVEQIGSPREIYDRPGNAFVAEFVGTSNVLDAAAAECITGIAKPLSLRPEKISILVSDQSADGMAGVIADIHYMGAHTRYIVDVGDENPVRIAVQRQNVSGDDLTPGARVTLSWDEDALRPLDGGL